MRLPQTALRCWFPLLVTLCAISGISPQVGSVTTAHAQDDSDQVEAVTNDFDGDGVSDFVSTQSSGSELLWDTIRSSGDETARGYKGEKFGAAADIPAPGFWQSADAPSLGVIVVSAARNIITWKALQGDDAQVSVKDLGKPGDYVISGGDFNGDGVADAAVARLEKGKYTWEVLTSPLGAGSSKRYSFTLGQLGDRLSFMRLTGGYDWPCAFGRSKDNKRSQLVARSLVKRTNRTFRGFPASLTASAGQRPRPIPLRQENGADAIIFVTTDETNTTVRTYSAVGSLVHRTTLNGLGMLVRGDFDPSSPGYEFVLKAPNGLFVVNPFANKVEKRSDSTGTITDSFKVVQTVGVVPTPTPGPNTTPTVAPTPPEGE